MNYSKIDARREEKIKPNRHLCGPITVGQSSIKMYMYCIPQLAVDQYYRFSDTFAIHR